MVFDRIIRVSFIPIAVIKINMMDYHPMQACILFDKQYQSAVQNALTTIRKCFCTKLTALHQAYLHHTITNDQLHTARKNLMTEAAFILYTHPADDPQTILHKLTTAAAMMHQETKSFQVETYLSKLSN